MDVVIERCAGLDVHKKTVVACVRMPRSGRAKQRLRETRTFTTTMRGLEALRGGLASHGVTDAPMESSGVYWRPERVRHDDLAPGPLPRSGRSAPSAGQPQNRDIFHADNRDIFGAD